MELNKKKTINYGLCHLLPLRYVYDGLRIFIINEIIRFEV